MRKEIGSRIAGHARLAWLLFGFLVLFLLLLPDLSNAAL